MKCNKCEAELEEGLTLCPQCGYENEPAQDCAQEEVSEVTADQEIVEEEVNEELTGMEEASEEQSEENPEEKSEIKEGKLTPGKITLLVVLAVAAIAVIVALIAGSFGGKTEQTVPEQTVLDSTTVESEETVETTEATIPADTGLNDPTCKGSYTVSDEEIVAQMDTVVATVDAVQLTNSHLQIYYWMQFYDFMSAYSSYASMLGLDYTQPLDMQLSPDGVQTWQQYFLNGAVNMWHSYNALAMDAKDAGFEMEAEYADFLTGLKDTLEENAVAGGYESAEAMLQADMGVGATMDEYIVYMNDYYLGYLYYNSLVDGIEFTEEEVEAYYTENEATFVENGVEKTEANYVSVRHILFSPEGGTTGEDGTVTYSEEEWEACRAAAQELLDQWAAGEATEEAFAKLANEHSVDPGSNTNGGLYENVTMGQMVAPFEEWCFDASRQYGDSGLVKTDYGYHIMFFVDAEPIWFASAEEEMVRNESTKLLEDSMARHPMEIDYSKIALGFVDMSQG